MFQDGKKVNSDAYKAKVFEKVFFLGGHLQKKRLDEFCLNGAVSVVYVAKHESGNNLEQNWINDICDDFNIRITFDELGAAIRRVDSSKGCDS